MVAVISTGCAFRPPLLPAVPTTGTTVVVDSEIQLAPGLLIATPQLADPNFHKSVVLMVEHQGEGAYGLVINRPTETPLAELLNSIEIGWSGSPAEPSWIGGPVQPETGWILHERVDGLDESLTREISPGLYLSSARDALEHLAAAPPRQIRFLLGYSGWGPAQLESELSEGSWVNGNVDPGLIFETPASTLWEEAVRAIGVDPNSLAPASGIH